MKKAGIVVLVLLVGYFGIIPMFWPEPKVSVQYPPEFRIGEDLTLTVKMSAWHGLFAIKSVRFVPDAHASAAIDVANPIHPLQPYSAATTRYGRAQRLMRFTRPVSRTRQVEVSLSDTEVRNNLKRGELVGKIDVCYTCATYLLRTLSTKETTTSQPFHIRVLPADSGVMRGE